MVELFQNKYRIKSIRLKKWNYRSAGWYFITICTKYRKMFFGDVINNKMVSNEIGKIAQNYLSEIQNHFENIKLDENIVMPNHIHGIIAIINGCNERRDEALPRLYNHDNNGNKSNESNAPNNLNSKQFYSQISPKPKSLSVIIGSFKSICTKTINKKFPNFNFQWQSRFYEHIIRNDVSLNHIRQYIIDNPAKWEFDKNNPKNL